MSNNQQMMLNRIKVVLAEKQRTNIKVFSYTATDHRKRFEQCAYTKEEYTARRDSARVVKEAFVKPPGSLLDYIHLLRLLFRRENRVRIRWRLR